MRLAPDLRRTSRTLLLKAGRERNVVRFVDGRVSIRGKTRKERIVLDGGLVFSLREAKRVRLHGGSVYPSNEQTVFLQIVDPVVEFTHDIQERVFQDDTVDSVGF